MPFPANVFNVLIASPSDVPKERDTIANCLYSWNALNSRDTGIVLLPVMWESHSAPSMGDRPQEVINEQMVRSCDLLIGAFWMRLGSPTGKAQSGTVEEIKWFLRQKKPVMLYFSTAPLQQQNLDVDQWNALSEFKKELMPKGLLGQYDDLGDLANKLSRQLTIVMREMSVVTTVDAKAVKRASESAEQDIVPSDKAVNGSEVHLENYSDKSFIVRGNTIDFKDALREIGGSWISVKSGGKAWCFSKRKLNPVADLLGIEPVIREP